MKLLPDEEERLPLFWCFVSVHLFCLALTVFLGLDYAFVGAVWAYVGVTLLTSWRILPAMPRTLPGNLIRLAWACIWPYYFAKRCFQVDGQQDGD